MNLAELLRPPSEETVARDIASFNRDLIDHYGSRLVGLYLFGSRSRGDNRPDSDVDLAVVLAGPFSFWNEVKTLSDMSYPYLIGDGVEIQASPVHASVWEGAEPHSNPSLLRAMKRDGKRLL